MLEKLASTGGGGAGGGREWGFLCWDKHVQPEALQAGVLTARFSGEALWEHTCTAPPVFIARTGEPEAQGSAAGVPKL